MTVLVIYLLSIVLSDREKGGVNIVIKSIHIVTELTRSSFSMSFRSMGLITHCDLSSS